MTLMHRVIILNRGNMPRKRTGRKWCNSSRPQCVTPQRDFFRDCALSNGSSWEGGLGGGAEGEVCILHSPGIAASPISLLSMGGVCGRSLTEGIILFTGLQTCSLYLVLWLCALVAPVFVFRVSICNTQSHILAYILSTIIKHQRF